MQIRNDKNKAEKQVEIGDFLFWSAVKYQVYAISDKSIKIKAVEEKIASGFKRNDFINKNTFAKRFFFDKVAQYWKVIMVRSMPNMDYF